MLNRVRALIALLFLAALVAPEAACAVPASPSAAMSAASGNIGIIAANKRKTVVAPVYTYDQSIGNGVDTTTGTANLPLRAGANRYYVNSGAASITGSDANTCTQAKNPATPKATMASAYTCLVDGNGDQMLVAEGSTYTASIPAFNISGFSATYPVVYESYDPADPTNEAKLGRATTNRPVINTGSTAAQYISCCQTYPKKFIALRGFNFSPSNVADQVLNIIGSTGRSNHYVLVENNLFNYTMINIGEDIRDLAQHIIIRRNSFHGSWSGGAHSQSIYSDGIATFTVEDNFFYHSGWKEGLTRTSNESLGGPTIYNHAIYMQDDVDGIIRRNIGLDASATFCSCRGTVDIRNNVAIDNPIGYIAGLGNSYQLVRPNGEYLFLTQNVAFGDADISLLPSSQGDNPRGNAFSNGNGKLGSRASFNLAARSRNPSGINVTALNTQSGVSTTPVSNFDWHDNVEYSWAASGAVKTLSGGGSAFNVTYENNAWSDPASGSNVNIASHAVRNAYTASTLYPALGFSDKAQAVANWQAKPELFPARAVLALLTSGYAVGRATPEDLVLSRSSFILTGPYTGLIEGALDGSTISASGLPACITVDATNHAFTYDGGCSATSGTFTLTEAPQLGSPRNTTISYTIAASPTLGPISLSTPLVSGTPSSGTFAGVYGVGVEKGHLSIVGQLTGAGSTGFTTGPAAGDGAGIASRIWNYGGVSFTTNVMAVTENVNGATNSPHTTLITSGVGAGVSDATQWNPLDKQASVTLSGSNLTATFSTTQTNVRATQAHSKGKYYFEGVPSSIVGNGVGIGAANSSAGLSTFITGGGNSAGWYSSAFARGSDDGGGNLVTYTNNDVIGVAVDLNAHKIWWSLNGTWKNGDPVAGTGGYTLPQGDIYPIAGAQGSGAFTLRATSGSITGTPPSGYSVWGFVPVALRRRRKKRAANDNARGLAQAA